MNTDDWSEKIECEAERLGAACLSAHKKIVFAESLTAGLCAGSCANIPGASQWVWGGFVVYETQSKNTLLGVDTALLSSVGPVSECCALAMSQGALRNSKDGAQLAVALTGCAGPSEDGFGNPVGTVWISVTHNDLSVAQLFFLHGDRQSIRKQAVLAALQMAQSVLNDSLRR